MNSLEWRLKKLEDRLLGQMMNPPEDGIFDQLNSIAEQHKSFIDSEDQTYSRFIELYSKHTQQAEASATTGSSGASASSRAELVLAYEDDLTKYLNNIKTLAEKADKILDGHNWPDLSIYEAKLAELRTIHKDQFVESQKIDSKTEELIQVYNDLIGAFKRNMIAWDSALRET